MSLCAAYIELNFIEINTTIEQKSLLVNLFVFLHSLWIVIEMPVENKQGITDENQPHGFLRRLN